MENFPRGCYRFLYRTVVGDYMKIIVDSCTFLPEFVYEFLAKIYYKTLHCGSDAPEKVSQELRKLQGSRSK